MFLSVIICTNRRPEVIRQCLLSFESQLFQDLEVLIVGGEQELPVESRRSMSGSLNFHFLTSPPGLPKARNVGLRRASGQIICFFDDDVVLEENFLSKVVTIFQDPRLADVGGITGYDVATYPCPISLRWRLRRWLGITPTLVPGSSNHLGRNVPVNFLQPFSGFHDVKWLPGFCQIFRREAIEGLFYDEDTPAEDRDFSLQVGSRCRLVVCGDLRLAHYQDREGRGSATAATRQAAFGLGRSFAKRRRSYGDWLRTVHNIVGELLIDTLVAVCRPSWLRCKIAIVRVTGFVAGLNSLRRDSTAQ
jgi:glycosyltransferase involved in cell wall biosynthesis